MSDNNRFKLSDDEIRDTLCIKDLNTIMAIYDTSQKLYEEEIKRTSTLEDKSKNLLNGVGVILGIVFSVGGLTIDKIKNIPLPLIGCPRPYLSILYIMLGIFLVAAGIFSYKSMIIRKDWKTMNEVDIFRKDVVLEGEAFYKRYMITHVWKIYKNNFLINEKKAYWLGLGQKLFVVCLFILVIMVIIIGIYMYTI